MLDKYNVMKIMESGYIANQVSRTICPSKKGENL